jgi:hypothetical protein
VVSYINVLMRMVSYLTLRLQASAIYKALFGHGPNCDLGFCLGPRLGEGRGRILVCWQILRASSSQNLADEP